MNSRKSFSHEEKVSLAYLTYNSKMASAFFPDKESSANEVISALANIYGLNLDECTAQDYTDILKTYTDTLIRIAMGSPKEMIATSLQIKHGKLVKNQEIANRVLSYITLNNNTGESSGIRNGNASKPKETFKTVSAAPEKDVFEDEVIEKEKRDINSTPLLDRENNSPHEFVNAEPVKKKKGILSKILPWAITVIAVAIGGVYMYSYYSAMQSNAVLSEKCSEYKKTSDQNEEKAHYYDTIAYNADLIGSNSEDVSFGEKVVVFPAKARLPKQVPLYTKNGGELAIVVSNEEVLDAKFTENSWTDKTMIELTAKKPGATLVIVAKNDGESEETLEYTSLVVFVQDTLPQEAED